MNYDNCNKIQEFWMKKIYPMLHHRFTVTSFDDYLRRFSFLPSGKWLQEMECVKLSKVSFAVNPEKFSKKYQGQCVTYNTPVKSEDGFQRVIYQITPTLHVEAGYWIWMEHDMVQSYVSLFVCYHNEGEYSDFINEIWKMRQEGDTEDKPNQAGFLFAEIPESKEIKKEVKKSKIGFDTGD